jgi:hypothetical protein
MPRTTKTQPTAAPAKPKRGSDTTGAKRQRELRATKPEIRAFLTPEEFAEVEALIAAGECTDKADVIRQAVHEKYSRFMKKKT